MDGLKVKRWGHILHFFMGGTAHGKERGYEVGDGEGTGPVTQSITPITVILVTL